MPDSPARRDPGREAGRDPGVLRPRQVGLLMALWTALIGGWYAWVAAGGALPTPTLGLAVLGLFAGVWLIGLLILGLFLVSGD